jgi:hypothetical protein
MILSFARYIPALQGSVSSLRCPSASSSCQVETYAFVSYSEVRLEKILVQWMYGSIILV